MIKTQFQRLILPLVALILVSCNLPTAGGRGTLSNPTPTLNQTLTALAPTLEKTTPPIQATNTAANPSVPNVGIQSTATKDAAPAAVTRCN